MPSEYLALHLEVYRHLSAIKGFNSLLKDGNTAASPPTLFRLMRYHHQMLGALIAKLEESFDAE